MNLWPETCRGMLRPLKRTCALNPETLPESTDPDFEFEYIDIGSVTLEAGIFARESMKFESAPSRARKPVRAGDVIVSTVRTYLKAVGSIGQDADRCIVSTGFAVLRPDYRVDPRFLYRVVQSNPFVEGVVAASTGVSYPAINPSTLGNIPIPCPDVPTQKAIADFLDRETDRIDRLIEKKQRLLEVLAEGLAALREEATTPAEIIFEEMIPFRWVCRIAEGQVDPTDPRWTNQPLIAPNHIQSATGRLLQVETAEEQGAISGKYAYPAGTVLYSKIRPALAKACIAPQAGMCSADMYPIMPDKRLLPEFLLLQLLSRKFTDWATLESMRVAMPRINRETLGNYRLWVPDKQVQSDLLARFQAAQAAREPVFDKVAASIERLREFRAALITAAVTGQVDVATWSKRGQPDRRLDAIQREMAS